MAHLTDSPIDPQDVAAMVHDARHGAVVSFVGTVRDHHAGHQVTALRYECYGPMAEVECERIESEAEVEFGARVAVRHRIGDLVVGDVAVVVAAAAAHRDAAFAAARWTIDEVKQRVPIWKHERYADGSTAWVDPTTSAGMVR
jgi:molybdopterin synthase catalytic subunit